MKQSSLERLLNKIQILPYVWKKSSGAVAIIQLFHHAWRYHNCSGKSYEISSRDTDRFQELDNPLRDQATGHKMLDQYQ